MKKTDETDENGNASHWADDKTTYDQARDFFTGQDFKNGLDLKLFLTYNYSKNRFYPYGDFDNLADEGYAEKLLKEDLEFADQDIQIVNWSLHHGSSYEGGMGNGKRSSWTEYSLGIDYVQGGVLKGRVFHFQSTKIIKDDN